MAAMRRNLLNTKKNASRVADENIASTTAAIHTRSPSRWNDGASFLCGIVLAPFSLFSCLSHPHINGPDGVWVSAELPQTSELTHLMVRDSLRYAILMWTGDARNLFDEIIWLWIHVSCLPFGILPHFTYSYAELGHNKGGIFSYLCQSFFIFFSLLSVSWVLCIFRGN